MNHIIGSACSEINSAGSIFLDVFGITLLSIQSDHEPSLWSSGEQLRARTDFARFMKNRHSGVYSVLGHAHNSPEAEAFS